MDLERSFDEIKAFSQEAHGSSDYNLEEFFVKGRHDDEFAPMKYLCKKVEDLSGPKDFLSIGFILNSFDLMRWPRFQEWFERQFARKLTKRIAKNIYIISEPKNKEIFDAIESIHQNYEVLKKNKILINNKNLPVQIGEWYAKFIFGLKQVKSASQRGFDLYLDDKRIEIKIHWSDQSSPKGVKIRKSLVQLSEFCVIIYLMKNFMIREICFLDSSFISRKFSTKGHTFFLKDSDLFSYFFSRSHKYLEKVVNSTALLKFSSPTFALKLAEKFQ